MDKDESGNAQKPRLRKSTEDFIPEIQKAAMLSSNILHFSDIINEWNITFANDLMAVGKYKFNAEFMRLPSYRDPVDNRKKFDGAKVYNSDKVKPQFFDKATYLYVQADAYDDIHKVAVFNSSQSSTESGALMKKLTKRSTTC